MVKLVFELRAAGERWSTIIRELHDRGVASPSGQPYWTTGTLATWSRAASTAARSGWAARVTLRAHKPIVTERFGRPRRAKRRACGPGSTSPVSRTASSPAQDAAGRYRCSRAGTATRSTAAAANPAKGPAKRRSTARRRSSTRSLTTSSPPPSTGSTASTSSARGAT